MAISREHRYSRLFSSTSARSFPRFAVNFFAAFIAEVNAPYEIRITLRLSRSVSFPLSLSLSLTLSLSLPVCLYSPTFPPRDSNGRVVKNFPTELCGYGNR